MKTPNLPGLYAVSEYGSSFGESEMRMARAIADAIYELAMKNTIPTSLPGLNTLYGEGEQRKAVAIAQALQEKGLIINSGVDVPEYGHKVSLQTDKVFYVDNKSGEDKKGAGLGPNTPFKSLFYALGHIRHNYDFNGFSVILSVAPGLYGPIELKNLTANGTLKIRGIGDDRQDVRFERLYAENITNDLFLENITIQRGCYFENCNTVNLCKNKQQEITAVNSRIVIQKDIQWRGHTSYALKLDANSLLDGKNCEFIFEESKSYAAYALVTNQSSLVLDSAKYSYLNEAKVEGIKFIVKGSSHISTGTGDSELLPGNLPGRIDGSSAYDEIRGQSVIDLELKTKLDKIAKKGSVPQTIDAATRGELETLSSLINSLSHQLREQQKKLDELKRQKSVTEYKGRTGKVLPQKGDYTTEDVTHDKYNTAHQAIEGLRHNYLELAAKETAISFNNRSGNISPEQGDYTSREILHEGEVLAELIGDIKSKVERIESSYVASYNNRRGHVKPIESDYGIGNIEKEILNLQEADEEKGKALLKAESDTTENKRIISKVGNTVSELSTQLANVPEQLASVQQLGEENTKAIEKLSEHSRYKLSEDMTISVGPAPFISLQSAIDHIYAYFDLSGYGVKILIEENLTEDFIIKGNPVGVGEITITGDIGKGSITNCDYVKLEDCLFEKTLLVENSQLVLSDCTFIGAPIGLKANNSGIILEGVTIADGGDSISFASLNDYSQLRGRGGSALNILRKYDNLITTNNQSTLDLRSITFEGEAGKVSIYNRSVLLGKSYLTDAIQLETDDTSVAIY